MAELKRKARDEPALASADVVWARLRGDAWWPATVHREWDDAAAWLRRRGLLAPPKGKTPALAGGDAVVCFLPDGAAAVVARAEAAERVAPWTSLAPADALRAPALKGARRAQLRLAIEAAERARAAAREGDDGDFEPGTSRPWLRRRGERRPDIARAAQRRLARRPTDAVFVPPPPPPPPPPRKRAKKAARVRLPLPPKTKVREPLPVKKAKSRSGERKKKPKPAARATLARPAPVAAPPCAPPAKAAKPPPPRPPLRITLRSIVDLGATHLKVSVTRRCDAALMGVCLFASGKARA